MVGPWLSAKPLWQTQRKSLPPSARPVQGCAQSSFSHWKHHPSGIAGSCWVLQAAQLLSLPLSDLRLPPFQNCFGHAVSRASKIPQALVCVSSWCVHEIVPVSLPLVYLSYSCGPGKVLKHPCDSGEPTLFPSQPIPSFLRLDWHMLARPQWSSQSSSPALPKDFLRLSLAQEWGDLCSPGALAWLPRPPGRCPWGHSPLRLLALWAWPVYQHPAWGLHPGSDTLELCDLEQVNESLKALFCIISNHGIILPTSWNYWEG